MQRVYEELIEFIVSSGKRIDKRAGNISDIGVKKQYLTEEDINIERGMKEIIKRNYPAHDFFAEEEHDSFPENADVWVADPISGTRSFIQGFPHYGIVIAYTKNQVVQFATVYDPSVDELFIAYRAKGAFLNGQKINVSQTSNKIILNLTAQWKDENSSQEIVKRMKKFQLIRNKNSHAVNLCYVACGRADGVICLGKDSFPYFAGGLILQEAGGKFTNKQGDNNIHHGDRVFVGGNEESYQKLREVLQQVKLPDTSE